MRRSRRFVAQVLIVVVGVVAVGCASVSNGEQSRAVEPQPENSDPIASSAVEAVASAPTIGEAPTESIEAPAQAQGAVATNDIRTVDFRNGFTYPNAANGDSAATVANGEYANGEFGDPDYFLFGVTDVQYGDLNGDGAEEAIVAVGYSGGGSGFFESIRGFALVDGFATDIGTVGFGDRAFGGIADIFINDGVVSVLAFTNGQGSCCATEAAVVRLVLGDHFLTDTDTQDNLAWSPLSQFGEQQRIAFLPGTSGAYATMWGDDLESSFVLEAGAGQVLTVEAFGGPAPSQLTISDGLTGEVVGLGEPVVLPADGDYSVEVLFDTARQESTVLLVQIDAEPNDISWTPQTEQTVVSTEPLVQSSLTWPAFASATADDASVEAANEALASLARGRDNLWIEGVTEYPPLPDQPSSFELTYWITYAADDLVSVHFGFYDYVCCRPYPNYGPLTAVLDLGEGRLIPAHEILDLDRFDEIRELWVAGLETQGQLPADLVDAIDLTAASFETVGLVDDGVELGAGRGSLAGGTPGTSVVLTFEELGDLVQPGLLARLGR